MQEDRDQGQMEVEAVQAATAANASSSTGEGLLPTDHTMCLTPSERQWALGIKAAVEDWSDDNHTELGAMCDFDYAQWAIVTKGNINEALRRIGTIQAFQKNYKIDNSVDQAVFYLNALMEQQPGFVLNLNVDLIRQESVNCYDVGNFLPKVAMGCSQKNGDGSDSSSGGIFDNWQVCLGGVYYLKYACQPSLAVIRNGFMELIDFGDYEWENFSMEAQERLFGELLTDYPMFEKHLLAYNTGYIANLGFSLAKPILPESMKNSIHLGCQVIESEESQNPTRKLRDFYLQPSPEIAQKNLLGRARLLVAMRHHNELTFRL